MYQNRFAHLAAVAVLALVLAAGCSGRNMATVAQGVPDLPLKVVVEGQVAHVLYEGQEVQRITVADGLAYAWDRSKDEGGVRQVVSAFKGAGKQAVFFDIAQHPWAIEPCEEGGALVDCGLMPIQGYQFPYRVELNNGNLLALAFVLHAKEHGNTWLRVGYGEAISDYGFDAASWPDRAHLTEEHRLYLRDVAERMRASFHMDETLLYKVGGPGMEHL
jgi:hypothetical protein